MWLVVGVIVYAYAWQQLIRNLPTMTMPGGELDLLVRNAIYLAPFAALWLVYKTLAFFWIGAARPEDVIDDIVISDRGMAPRERKLWRIGLIALWPPLVVGAYLNYLDYEHKHGPDFWQQPKSREGENLFEERVWPFSATMYNPRQAKVAIDHPDIEVYRQEIERLEADQHALLRCTYGPFGWLNKDYSSMVFWKDRVGMSAAEARHYSRQHPLTDLPQKALKECPQFYYEARQIQKEFSTDRLRD